MEREVLITWRDEPESDFLAHVAIDPDWLDKDDDVNIFFYFGTEEEYQEALINGTDEFTIREYA